MAPINNDNRNIPCNNHEAAAQHAAQNGAQNGAQVVVPVETADGTVGGLPTAAQEKIEADELLLLGERISKEREYGEPVQQEIADRILDIVRLGLEEKEIKNLLEVLVPPSNCKIIDPPKVNVEATFKDSSAKERDRRIFKNQMKASAALSALQQAVSIMLNQKSQYEKISEVIIEEHVLSETIQALKDERKTVLNLVSNASRLTADLQHEMSMCRRGVCLGSMFEISEFVRDQIKNQCPIDEYLFGSNFGDVIKIAKASENARKSLNGSGNKKPFYKSKNERAPPRAGNQNNRKGSPRPFKQGSRRRSRNRFNKERGSQRSKKTS